jgi:hypothetical protein
MLFASTIFAVTLWMDSNLLLRLKKVWSVLATREHEPIPRSYINLLEVLIIGRGLRSFPGGFVDPYTTQWGHWMRYFVRAGIPIWFIWGKEDKHRRIEPVEPDMRFYLAPNGYIAMMKQRQIVYASIILPFDPSTIVHEDVNLVAPPVGPPILLPNASAEPLDQESWPEYEPWAKHEPEDVPLPVPENPREHVQHGSGQRAGEDWEAFFTRREEAFQCYLLLEDAQKKQS